MGVDCLKVVSLPFFSLSLSSSCSFFFFPLHFLEPFFFVFFSVHFLEPFFLLCFFFFLSLFANILYIDKH